MIQSMDTIKGNYVARFLSILLNLLDQMDAQHDRSVTDSSFGTTRIRSQAACQTPFVEVY